MTWFNCLPNSALNSEPSTRIYVNFKLNFDMFLIELIEIEIRESDLCFAFSHFKCVICLF